MTISLITPCLNAAETIVRTFDSVEEQGGSLHEHLVIDGGSTDGTVGPIEAYQARIGARLKWVSEPDRGIYDAMNKGLALASGDWVLVLGADDALEPGALAAVAHAAAANPGADLIYGDAYVLEPDGRRHLQSSMHGPRLASGLPLEMPVCHQACAFSTRACRQLGGFDLRYQIAADYDFYLRFHEEKLRSVRVPAPLATYSLEGVSSRLAVATARDYRDVRIAHGMPKASAQLRMARSLVNVSAMRVLRKAGWARG
ncbi:MAG: glycosyltransferase family 2 protein [Coriobacteriia bacterium]|nr:glycosyltransferase family 2 protein [Coriobacteriia bacterium]